MGKIIFPTHGIEVNEMGFNICHSISWMIYMSLREGINA